MSPRPLPPAPELESWNFPSTRSIRRKGQSSPTRPAMTSALRRRRSETVAPTRSAEMRPDSAGTKRRPAGEPAHDQRRQPQHEAEHEAQVHPGQQRVVAAVAKMRDAALVDAQVAHRRVDVERAHAAPCETNDGLGVE